MDNTKAEVAVVATLVGLAVFLTIIFISDDNSKSITPYEWEFHPVCAVNLNRGIWIHSDHEIMMTESEYQQYCNEDTNK